MPRPRLQGRIHGVLSTLYLNSSPWHTQIHLTTTRPLYCDSWGIMVSSVATCARVKGPVFLRLVAKLAEITITGSYNPDQQTESLDEKSSS